MNKKVEFIAKELSTVNSDDNVIVVEGYANKFLDQSNNMIVDRSGEVVLPESYDLRSFMKNPILLYQHRKDEPVGKVVSVAVKPDGLYVKAEVHKKLNEKVFYAVKNGILKTFSIGFLIRDAKEIDDVLYWTDIELVEVSIVTVPDNPESLFVISPSPCGDGTCVIGQKAIRNNKISLKPWSSVNKTELAQRLAELGNVQYIKEAYLVVRDVEKRSTWKFPHHELDGSDLVLNKGGVVSAYAALKGARNEPAITPQEKLEAAKHLLKHYKEMKTQGVIEEIPQDLIDMAKEFEAEVKKGLEMKVSKTEYTSENIESVIAEETGLSQKIVRKMIMFLSFALVKSDGSLTKFAQSNKFSKESLYQDLYDWMKNTKQQYKTDHEIDAFSENFKSLALSSVSRASAWIYNTFIKPDNPKAEDYLKARTLAESWFFNALGITFENLLKFKAVVSKMDKYQDAVLAYVNAQTYSTQSEKDSDFVHSDQDTQIFAKKGEDSESSAKNNENKEGSDETAANSEGAEQFENKQPIENSENETEEGSDGDKPKMSSDSSTSQENSVSVDAIKTFIQNAKNTPEDLETLLALYLEIEAILNEKLPEVLSNNQ